MSPPREKILTREEHRCFGGTMGFYEHFSSTVNANMRFGVFVPPQARQRRVPTIYYLPGLTCTEETYFIKAGAQRVAAELGVALVSCDSSPRDLGLPGECDDWDFGAGASFYIDATVSPWSHHYRMHSYISADLVRIVERNFPVIEDRRAIMGHSMGGHGALVAALRKPHQWMSASAIAPISNPISVPWGIKAFSGYLGPDRTEWERWDASCLMRKLPHSAPILVDQGADDQYLATQLRPNALIDAATESKQVLILNLHEGYDHSYWFVQSVIEKHLARHAQLLRCIDSDDEGAEHSAVA